MAPRLPKWCSTKSLGLKADEGTRGGSRYSVRRRTNREPWLCRHLWMVSHPVQEGVLEDPRESCQIGCRWQRMPPNGHLCSQYDYMAWRTLLHASRVRRLTTPGPQRTLEETAWTTETNKIKEGWRAEGTIYYADNIRIKKSDHSEHQRNQKEPSGTYKRIGLPRM